MKYGFLLICIVLCSLTHGQELRTISFEDLEQVNKSSPRPTVVFFHTDWCKFCQQMKHTTFAYADLIQLLNERFYFVSFDAEQKEAVSFLGHSFEYQPSGNKQGTHMLAKELGTIDGKLNYPTITFLNVQYEIIFQHGGLMTSEELLAALKAVK